MENKKTVIGSATIMAMIVLTMLIIMSTTAFHTATMLHDLAMQRVAVHRQQRASHALLHYGIACCYTIDTFKEKKKEYTYFMPQWPIHSDAQKYEGSIVIIPQKRWYEVKAELYREKKRMARESCVVWKEKTRWKIANFVG